jgi:hypothetical protein
VWPGVISVEDSDRLRELLTRPTRNTGPKERDIVLRRREVDAERQRRRRSRMLTDAEARL